MFGTGGFGSSATTVQEFGLPLLNTKCGACFRALSALAMPSSHGAVIIDVSATLGGSAPSSRSGGAPRSASSVTTVSEWSLIIEKEPDVCLKTYHNRIWNLAMPLYRVYHPKDILDDPTKASLAAEITERMLEEESSVLFIDAHTNVTVLFIPFSASDALWAGTPAPPFVRVVAVIRAGLPGQLLASLYTIFGHALKGDALAQITLVEHRPEDTVRWANADAPQDILQWAAVSPPSPSFI